MKSQLLKYIKTGNKRGPEYSEVKCVNDHILFAFHRLAINGLNSQSNQPFVIDDIVLICNGEIYNHNEIFKSYNLLRQTDSDCESIIHLYNVMYDKCASMLDGVFSFILYDRIKCIFMIARDPYGVRPLYICEYDNNDLAFSSDIEPCLFRSDIRNIRQFEPGTYEIYQYTEESINDCRFNPIKKERYHYMRSLQCISKTMKKAYTIEYYMYEFVQNLKNAILKRVENCERQIACLLSGGLDSSIISAYVSRYYYNKTGNTLETYSIGLKDATDFRYAKKVSDHIHSKHTEIVMTNSSFLKSIPNVIKDIESYDTTTVRASVGNWNIGKYISKNSSAKVIFNGDGADELMGGYLYFHHAPDNESFDRECDKLLSEISHYDVLRSDKGISSHGLEPRTPFLDKELTKYYLSIPVEYRNHNHSKKCEKYFIRKAIELYDPTLLPSKRIVENERSIQ